MLPGGLSGSVWMEDRGGNEETHSWAQNNNNNGGLEKPDEMSSLSSFKTMLGGGLVEDENWFVTGNSMMQNHHDVAFPPNFADNNHMLLQSVDSSASCSPSSVSAFTNLDPNQVHNYFLPPKPTMNSILNPMGNNNPLEGGFNLGCENGFLTNQAMGGLNRGGGVLTGFADLSPHSQMGSPSLTSNPQFTNNQLLQFTQNHRPATANFGFPGFSDTSGSANSLFLNRSKMLKPLENLDSVAAQPTLFQKRAALRKNLASSGSNLGGLGSESGPSSDAMNDKSNNGEDGEDVSIDGSGFNYDSDEFLDSIKVEDGGKNGGTSSNANSTVTGGGGGGGDDKGKKKKGLPAKNLMAERRRRKKLNDRLYMLRSVVPKISKMDRASILGDAVEYLKELLQKINELHNELESNPPPGSSSLTPSPTSLYPLTPTPTSLSGRIKEELYPSTSMLSPNGQPTRVEVRLREGRAVNIHMFCSRRPGLLLSTMRALDSLGLDVQQAVISCFNGFALDIFRAEHCKESPDVHPDEIKAVLLDSAGLLP